MRAGRLLHATKLFLEVEMTALSKPWREFRYAGVTYSLDHLLPRTMVYVVQKTLDRPETRYTVDVSYSTHCFTRGMTGEGHDRDLEYRDGREKRVFDFRRFELSRSLPEIIETLVGRKCHHAERGNFFTVEQVDENGTTSEYNLFFTVSKSSRRGRLNLFIQSAYTGATLPRKVRPIRFEIILFNTLHKKPMR